VSDTSGERTAERNAALAVADVRGVLCYGTGIAARMGAAPDSHFYRAPQNPGSGHKTAAFLSDDTHEIRAPRAPACRGPRLSSNSIIRLFGKYLNALRFSSAC
jgi:hypothetical protein